MGKSLKSSQRKGIYKVALPKTQNMLETSLAPFPRAKNNTAKLIK